MQIQITEQIQSELSLTVAATAGKVSGVVSISKYGCTVLCLNASHRAWNGGGRHFHTLEMALIAYKSPEMRAIIQLAHNLSAPAVVAIAV